MHPDTPVSDNTNVGAWQPRAEFDEWRALQLATDTARANIIADIVGHPEGMISVEELAYMNPDLSEDAVRRHLHKLLDVGVVEEHSLGSGERMRDFPYKFYSVSADARELFDRNELFPEAAWKREYRGVKKTPRIRELETMPRPNR